MSSIYLSNTIFMMIILTIIFLRIRYYITWSPSKKYTMIFIGMVELYVLMDALFMKELLGKYDNDFCPKRHCFCLIVCNINDGGI